MTTTRQREVSPWQPRIGGDALGTERSAAVGELWREYKRNRGRAERDRLILHYAPFVKFVALRAAAGLAANIDRSDVVSYGIFGLIDAIEKFDPSLGFKFETYAMPRIRGAILDELRANDHAPRSVRAKKRAIERAFSTLENRYCRTPSDAEVARELGLSAKQLAKARGQINFADIVSLDEPLLATSREPSMTRGEAIADVVSDDPADAFGAVETSEILADEMRLLPERERLVLTLYYYKGMNLAEIGEQLHVTESRVCQIHRKAILQLRSRIAEPALAAG